MIGRDSRPIHLTDEKDRPILLWSGIGEAKLSLAVRPAKISMLVRKQLRVRSFARLSDYSTRTHPFMLGVENLDPRDVIAEVLKFLRTDAVTDQPAVRPQVDRAVMTIPVKLDGAGRRRLREAASRAQIGIVQFVHEPLAALYAYLRSQTDYRRHLAELDGCRILVFDWGGGTLDLTLCQVHGDQIVQIANVGDDEVGGDRFDEIIRNYVRDTHARQHEIDDLPLPLKGMKRASYSSIKASFEKSNCPIARLRQYLSETTSDVRGLDGI